VFLVRVCNRHRYKRNVRIIILALAAGGYSLFCWSGIVDGNSLHGFLWPRYLKIRFSSKQVGCRKSYFKSRPLLADCYGIFVEPNLTIGNDGCLPKFYLSKL